MASVPRSLLPWLIFLLVASAHLRSKVETSYDSAYSIHLAMSLTEEGNLDLDEYRDVIPAGDYRVIEAGGHLHSRYPVGPSILAAPLLALAACGGVATGPPTTFEQAKAQATSRGVPVLLDFYTDW